MRRKGPVLILGIRNGTRMRVIDPPPPPPLMAPVHIRLTQTSASYNSNLWIEAMQDEVYCLRAQHKEPSDHRGARTSSI